MPVTFLTARTHPYWLDGKRVKLTEAADILGVGVATVMRHVDGGVIDTAAIRDLVPGEPFRKTKVAKASKPSKPVREPARYKHDGLELTLAEWADSTGIPAITLRQRIETYNWPLARAFSTPLQVSGRFTRDRNRRVIARIASTFHEARA